MINALPLQTPQEYQSGRENVFPSGESLRWFIRQHRGELVEAGALVAPTGRPMVAPDAFDRAVMSIGSRRAAGRGGQA